MNKQFKSKSELFYYLMHGYMYMLEDVPTKNGIQKRLKDNELEQSLKEQIKEQLKIDGLEVELKLGPAYNRTENPWVQLFTPENRSGAKGRYVGISFERDKNEVKLWIGFGRTAKKQSEVLELAKDYRMKYSFIEAELDKGFKYNEDCYDALIIEKEINIKDFSDAEFEEDLIYITNLYKEFETQYGTAIFKTFSSNEITYEEINERMLQIIEEVGELARAIKELGKK